VRSEPLGTGEEEARPRLTARRIETIYRREGLYGLVSRSLARLFGWRSYGVWLCPLDQLPPPTRPTLPVEIRALERREVPSYLAFRPGSADVLAERLRQGRVCFVAWSGPRIVATTWVATGPEVVPQLERAVVPGPGEVYLFDSYAAADMRGRRLMPALVDEILARYRALGYHRALTIVALYNRSSIRSRERSGFRRAATVNTLARGPIRTCELASSSAAA
jgi:GNAT superfamily N-acetyltransferase